MFKYIAVIKGTHNDWHQGRASASAAQLLRVPCMLLLGARLFVDHYLSVRRPPPRVSVVRRHLSELLLRLPKKISLALSGPTALTSSESKQ